MRNVHERPLPATAAAVGALIDGLAGEHDRLWPRDAWPPMKPPQKAHLERPLRCGPPRVPTASDRSRRSEPRAARPGRH